MNKDKALEELFLSQKPKFDDGDAFLASLNKRLDAVEYIKQYQAKKMRMYRHSMVAAFAFGIVLGGVLLMFALSMPELQIATHRIQIGTMNLLIENAQHIAIVIVSLLFAAAIVCIFNILVDISGMKMDAKYSRR